MTTKHTPGPWSLKSDPFHFDTLSSIVGGATKGDGKRFPSHELHIEIGGFADFRIQEANARLIAAAPELLEALRQIEYSVGQALISGNDWRRELALMRNTTEAAIAKATGEAR